MLNIGLIGCGRIAVYHASLLVQNTVEGARLAACCDVNEEKAKLIGEATKVPYYTDFHHMLKNESIDVISVLTESGYHAQHVIELSQYGKPIIVEKPMALTIEDADRMIEACQKNNVKLFVVKQNRFNLPIIKLRQALDEGRFGKLVMATVRVRWCRRQAYYDEGAWRGTWAMDGGVLTNQAIHHLDLLEWMMGPVESVFAKGIKGLAKIESDDTAGAILKFKNGALGMIEATTAARPKDTEASITIMGEKGMVEIGGITVNQVKVWQFEEMTEDDHQVIEQYSTFPTNVYGFGHRLYYMDAVNAIENDLEPFVDGHEGRKSVVFMNALYESMETGREVFLNESFTHSRLGRS